MLRTFIGSSVGMVAANFIYQFFCSHPNWDAASERSFFQIVALVGVGAVLGIRSIQ